MNGDKSNIDKLTGGNVESGELIGDGLTGRDQLQAMINEKQVKLLQYLVHLGVCMPLAARHEDWRYERSLHWFLTD